MIDMNQESLPSQEARKPTELALGPIIRKMLANPAALKKMRTMGPDEERYIRPPWPYDLPEYRHGMPHCTSSEKYLRPTRYCNPREPLVIAMANELGAYELSDWEFAEAAYWFVKTKFIAEFMPLNSVTDSLRRGTGTCFHMNSVWIALCRAAGIKARYKTFNMMLPDEFTSLAPSFGENEAM
ncbi:MAG: transglutaminase-like domain-containing protein, partial [Halobacteriota archaeon]